MSKGKFDKFGAVLIGALGFCLFGLVSFVAIFFVMLVNFDVSMRMLVSASLIGGCLVGLAFALTRLGRRITAGLLEIIGAFGA